MQTFLHRLDLCTFAVLDILLRPLVSFSASIYRTFSGGTSERATAEPTSVINRTIITIWDDVSIRTSSTCTRA